MFGDELSLHLDHFWLFPKQTIFLGLYRKLIVKYAISIEVQRNMGQ